ncbi:MAG: N-acetylmuramoyl-L-alanine amidase [Archangium sp.]|nr:N-acetylmuramoyl-L-alanine amidase [Archangium sp.]
MRGFAVLVVILGGVSDARPKLRVMIDAGHGAPGNDGNRGALCQLEKDHTAWVSSQLAKALPLLGDFDMRETRTGISRPTYPQRIHQAEVWKADAIVSIHSDARGSLTSWKPFEGQETQCFRSDAAPGFSVLWNDSGPAPVVAGRVRLGRAVISRLIAAGFTPYSGVDYASLYRPDDVAGGWIDLRPDGQNVYFLRASPRGPTVIIETHHAADVTEVAEWQKPETVQTFARALAAALLDAFPR